MCKTILSVHKDTLVKADKVMIFLNPFKRSKVSHSVRFYETKINLKNLRTQKKFMNELRMRNV